jgi:hypothetical protein
MKHAKHTPGPFFKGEQSTETGEPIVLICAEAREGENKTIARMVGPDSEANANLFLAAPEMLEALKMLVEAGAIQKLSDTGRADFVLRAIAKARGES